LKKLNVEVKASNVVTPIETCYKDKVKHAEIKLAAFFAEHNVAFSTVDHLIP